MLVRHASHLRGGGLAPLDLACLACGEAGAGSMGGGVMPMPRAPQRARRPSLPVQVCPTPRGRGETHASSESAFDCIPTAYLSLLLNKGR